MLAGGWFGGRQLWAWYHWRSGREAMQRYDFPAALEHFERCLHVWPDSQSVQLEAARAARRGNDYDRFDEHLDACEKKGATAETALERELVLAQRGNLKQDVEKALQDLAEGTGTEAVEVLEALAQGYMANFRLGGAMVALEKLIERAPDHKWAYYWRGNVQIDSEHLSDAVPDYRRAVELDPTATPFRLRLITSLVGLNKASAAWPHVVELLRQEPANAEGLLAAARCQRDFGDRARALEYLQRLLDAHPGHAEAWAERGRIASDQRDSAESIRCLRRAYDLEPLSYSIGFSLFNELTGQGKHTEAKVVLDEIERVKKLVAQLGKDRRNTAVRHELGTLFLGVKNEATALRLFDSVLQIDPEYRPTHEVLAEYYQRKGNTTAAENHRRHAGLPVP
jgi:tetratricopeptide (TPR) repeat protein